MKARKKPVVIDCFKYNGDNTDLLDWHLEVGGTEQGRPFDYDENGLFIITLEGNMTCEVGCYIIRGIQGEYYSCKADIFEATYDIL